MSGFQFQYGAIKSFISEIMNEHLIVFQFQYGAIKSNPYKEEFEGEWFDFNSSMVRLKVAISNAIDNLC